MRLLHYFYAVLFLIQDYWLLQCKKLYEQNLKVYKLNMKPGEEYTKIKKRKMPDQVRHDKLKSADASTCSAELPNDELSPDFRWDKLCNRRCYEILKLLTRLHFISEGQA